MKNMRIAVAGLAILIAGGASNICFAKKEAAGPAAPAMPPTIVETTIVKTTTQQQQLSATGTLLSIPGIIVRPEISGRVTNIFFKPGEKVNKDAPLIEINHDITSAQLADAKANLVLQQFNFERNSKLYKTRTIAKADYDKSHSDLDSARAKVDLANAQLRQTMICAPFAGKVGLNLVNVGAYVSAGQDIVSLQALNPIYVDFAIPEVYLKRIAVNQKVILESDAYPNETFVGNIYAIDPLINQNTRTISIRAVAPNPQEKLLPGSFVEVIVLTGEAKPVIKIPQVAVIFDAKGNYVYRYVNGKAVKALVMLGERDQKDITVLSGLTLGDSVITSGQIKIFADNTPVIAVPSQGMSSNKHAIAAAASSSAASAVQAAAPPAVKK